MKIKRISIIFIGLSLLFALSVSANEESTVEAEIKEKLNTEVLSEALDAETQNYLDMSGVEESSVNYFDFGKIAETFKYISSGVIPKIFSEFSMICSLLIVASLLSSFETDKNVSDIAITVISAFMIYPKVLSLSETVKNAAASLSVFIKSAIPVYAGIITFHGKASTGSAYAALTLFSAEAADFIVTSLALPLIPLMLSLSLTAAFTGKSFDKINEKIEKLIKWVLVITVTIFSAVTSLQTVVTSDTDALAMKGARLMVSTAVPIVGSALGDALNAVNGSLAVIRSGAGAFGILAVIFIFAPVVINITLNMLSLFFLSLICELFGMNKISVLINSSMSLYKLMIASIFTMVSVAVISAAILITLIK